MRVLILVDIQNDFLPGGALAVPDGDGVVPVANEVMSKFELVVATQDWHPAKHGSFASQHPEKKAGELMELNGLQQILWPDHCVRGTHGAALAAGLNAGGIHRVFQKGTDAGIDSYSGFFDNGHRKATGLGDYLKLRGASEVYIAGLATDYCVRFTALDARRLDFDARLILEGVRGVELRPGDCERAIDEMKRAGVHMVCASDL